MKQRKLMPIRSKFKPIQSRTQSTYDRYVAVQQQLGLSWKEIRREWDALCRASELASETRTIIKPIHI